MSEQPTDPMGILLNQPGQLADMPYLVTIQMQFKVMSNAQQKAELAVIHGISIKLPLAAAIIAQGVSAQPLTQQVLDELAKLAKEQGVKL